MSQTMPQKETKTPNIVGIVGCRHYENYKVVEAHLLAWEKKHGPIARVVSGGALGVDTLAETFASKHGKPLTVYKAKWRGKWGGYDKSAGPKRNALIVAAVNHLIAFPSVTSRGTLNTIKQAEDAKIPTTVYDI